MVTASLHFIGRNPSLELSLSEWGWKENVTVRRISEEDPPAALAGRDLFLWIPERYDNAVPQPVGLLSKAAPSLVCLPHGSMALARQALDAGFRDYLCLPCADSVLFHKLDRLLHPAPVASVVTGKTPDAQALAELSVLYGTEAVRQITNLAPFPTTVLLQSENGMQPGRAALALHSLSLRCGGPLAQVRLRGLPPLKMGETLFGAPGQPDIFQSARRGTLFVDGIEILPPEAQKRLFARLITRVSDEPAGSGSRDWRFVACTETPLEAAVQSGRFDRQLSVQVSVITVYLPPVRERLRHLPQIAAQLLAELSRELKLPARSLSPAALEKLSAYGWPGNLDELRAVLEGGILRSVGTAGGTAAAASGTAAEIQPADLWIEANPAANRAGLIYPSPSPTGHLPD